MKILLSFILLVSIGCVKNVDKFSHSLLLSDPELEILNQKCHELEQIGDIQDYSKIIALETNKVFDLIDNYRELEHERIEIMKRSQIVMDAINKIRELIREEYNVPLWDYEVKWKITKDDFKKFLGNYFPGGFEMTWIKPHAAFIFGEQENDLLKNISFRFGKKTANFTYKNKGTTLEICQLHKTRMLVMEVHYKHLGKNNKRYFNLISR